MRFIHHAEIGESLAWAVDRMVGPDAVVLALAPGGVRIGREIARKRRAPLDIVLVEPVEVPGAQCPTLGIVVDGKFRPNLAACAVQPGAEPYAAILAGPVCAAMTARASRLRGGRMPVSIEGRPVILVSDGSAGLPQLAAIADVLWNRGAREVLYASPVGCPGLGGLISPFFRVLTRFSMEEFRSVMLVNAENRQTTDEEIGRTLSEHQHAPAPAVAPPLAMA